MSERRAMTREEWLSNPTSMDKWAGPVNFKKNDGPPLTLASLLELLGVEDASFEVQKAAVDKWLETNEPTPQLQTGLRLDGFLPKNSK